MILEQFIRTNILFEEGLRSSQAEVVSLSQARSSVEIPTGKLVDLSAEVLGYTSVMKDLPPNEVRITLNLLKSVLEFLLCRSKAQLGNHESLDLAKIIAVQSQFLLMTLKANSQESDQEENTAQAEEEKPRVQPQNDKQNEQAHMIDTQKQIFGKFFTNRPGILGEY